jgi:hypothetical protein
MELEQAIKIVEEYQKCQKGEDNDYLYTRNERIEAIDELLETAKFIKFLSQPTTSPNP